VANYNCYSPPYTDHPAARQLGVIARFGRLPLVLVYTAPHTKNQAAEAITFCPQYNPEYRAGFVRCNVLFTLLALSVLHLMAARAVAQVTTETATREARPQSRREPSCPKRGTWGGQSTHYGKTGRVTAEGQLRF